MLFGSRNVVMRVEFDSGSDWPRKELSRDGLSVSWSQRNSCVKWTSRQWEPVGSPVEVRGGSSGREVLRHIVGGASRRVAQGPQLLSASKTTLDAHT